MLVKIADALNSEGIETNICNGSIYRKNNILNNFKNSTKRSVLAMSLNNVASGLNLTEASYIIFVNTPTNREIETQAIARIRRLGNTSEKINVVHFIARDTIEEILYKERQLEERQRADG